jgi:hypothetical protein
VLHALDVANAVLVRVLIIAAVLAVLGVLAAAWHAARRWRLVVTELTNSTGQPHLDTVTPGLTQLARQRIDREIRIVSERREALSAALTGTGPAAGHAPGSSHLAASRTPPAQVEQRLDDSLAQLLSATRDVTPKQAQPAIQLLAMLVSRPRGLLVAGILQQRGGVAEARLGVTFDVLRPDGNQSVASQTFWEPLPAMADAGADPEAGRGSAQERLIGLFGPAARWVAIQLVVNTVFPRGAQGREKGLDRLLSGMLFQQSVAAYPGYAATFRHRAVEDLSDAAGLLAESPWPPLAALADTLDWLATDEPGRAGDEKTMTYERAHAQYTRAVAAIERMTPPDPGLLQRYRVRQAISWLASGLPAPRQLALQWLATDSPGSPAASSASDLYGMACLYALAAEAAEHPEWRNRAACFLVRALAADAPSRRLWKKAQNDPQLHSLHRYLAAFEAAVESEPAGGQGNVPSGIDVDAIVERAFSKAN